MGEKSILSIYFEWNTPGMAFRRPLPGSAGDVPGVLAHNSQKTCSGFLHPPPWPRNTRFFTPVGLYSGVSVVVNKFSSKMLKPLL